MPLVISVQANPRDRVSWLDFAREVERAGFDGLYVGDHPGTVASPFVALGAAAAVTDRIQLGTCVVNAGVWDPIALAMETATLDAMSDGRARLGVGAGHTPAEWTARGLAYPAPSERVGRMIELVDSTRALLAGDTVSTSGRHFDLTEARLDEVAAVRRPVPLLIGGNGPRVLTYGAQHAERIGITGLVRTLADGQRHEVDWSEATLDQTLDTIASASDFTRRTPHIEALVQHIEITDDAEAAATRLLPHVPGASASNLLRAPYVWIGSAAEIQQRLAAHRHDRGITHYMIREPYLAVARRILGT